MSEVGVRQRVSFSSGREECVGWHYRGTNGACVVMAAGTAVTVGPGTDRFAARFHADGFSVLAFDFRHLGESGGEPRQVVRVGEQTDDYRAAIAYAATLPEVDPGRLAVWGFSLAAGHLFPIAAGHGAVAAVIAQSPFADGLAATPNMLRHESPGVALGFPLLALRDVVGGALGRPARLIPLAGARGTLAMLTTPDALDADHALNPGNRYPDWQQQVAARSVLPLMFYRPARHAARIECPMLMVICADDRSVLAAPARRAAGRARRAEVLSIPGGHYAPFLEQHERVVEAELSFLRRQLLDRAHG